MFVLPSPYAYKGVKYPDVFRLSVESAEFAFHHGKKIFAIGESFFTGNRKSLLFLATEKGLPLMAAKENRNRFAYDKNGVGTDSGPFLVVPL